MVGDLNLNSASINVNNYYCYFLSYCSMCEKNVVSNLHGSMLDVVLVRESTEVLSIRVEAAEGVYHPPLDIGVGIVTFRRSDRIEPSNVDPSKDWNLKKSYHGFLFHKLSNISWRDLCKIDDVHQCTLYLYTTIYDVFDDCVPKKQRKNL